jgi:hypothetical protein
MCSYLFHILSWSLLSSTHLIVCNLNYLCIQRSTVYHVVCKSGSESIVVIIFVKYETLLVTFSNSQLLSQLAIYHENCIRGCHNFPKMVLRIPHMHTFFLTSLQKYCLWIGPWTFCSFCIMDRNNIAVIKDM